VAAVVVVLATLVLVVVVTVAVTVTASAAALAAATSVAEDVISDGVTAALVAEAASLVILAGRDGWDDETRFQL